MPCINHKKLEHTDYLYQENEHQNYNEIISHSSESGKQYKEQN